MTAVQINPQAEIIGLDFRVRNELWRVTIEWPRSKALKKRGGGGGVKMKSG